MNETAPLPITIQQWPAIMTMKTLRAYLDCRTQQNWQAMRVLLREGGYQGVERRERFHRRDLVDAALGINGSTTGAKVRMMEAARRGGARTS
jgi:hypothetical protein